METQDTQSTQSPQVESTPAPQMEEGARSTAGFEQVTEPLKPVEIPKKTSFKDRLAEKAGKNGFELKDRDVVEKPGFKKPASTTEAGAGPTPPTTTTRMTDAQAAAARLAREAAAAANPGKPQVIPAEADPATPAADGTPPPGESGEYTPNYKFRVMDKEHEIPEFMRAAITDAESERAVKELHEKAMGLDIVKPRFQAERQKTQQLGERLGVYSDKVDALRKHYGRKDFGAIFRDLSLPENEVLQYFVERAKYNELTPEERQVYDQRQQAMDQAYQAEDRVESLQSDLEQQAAQAKRAATQLLFARQDVQSFIQGFEGQTGRKSGDFWNAFCDEGEYAYLQSKGQRDLTPEEAFEAVKRRYGIPAAAQTVPANANPPAPATAPAAPAPAAPAPQAHVAKPKPQVIPNVAGRASASPTPPKVRSIADLKKLAAQFNR